MKFHTDPNNPNEMICDDCYQALEDINSEWMDELGSAGFIRLASHVTVKQILERPSIGVPKNRHQNTILSFDGKPNINRSRMHDAFSYESAGRRAVLRQRQSERAQARPGQPQGGSSKSCRDEGANWFEARRCQGSTHPREPLSVGIAELVCYIIVDADGLARTAGPHRHRMFLPASRASFSTFAAGPTALMTPSRIREPSSGWAISRPRNCSVTFTL